MQLRKEKEAEQCFVKSYKGVPIVCVVRQCPSPQAAVL